MIVKRWSSPAMRPSWASSRVMSANFWRPSPVNWSVTMRSRLPSPPVSDGGARLGDVGAGQPRVVLEDVVGALGARVARLEALDLLVGDEEALGDRLHLDRRGDRVAREAVPDVGEGRRRGDARDGLLGRLVERVVGRQPVGRVRRRLLRELDRLVEVGLPRRVDDVASKLMKTSFAGWIRSLTTCSGLSAPGSATTICLSPWVWISGSATPNESNAVADDLDRALDRLGRDLARVGGLALQDHLDAALEVEPEHRRPERDRHERRRQQPDDDGEEEEGAPRGGPPAGQASPVAGASAVAAVGSTRAIAALATRMSMSSATSSRTVSPSSTSVIVP